MASKMILRPFLIYDIHHPLHTAPQLPLHLKIPKPQHCPAYGLVVVVDLPVSLHISLDLRNPEIPVGFDGGFAVFPIVAMPECTVHKNYQFVFDQADVRFAGEFLFVAFVADARMP